MRIRKNMKLSTILQFSAPPEWKIQKQVCQLNQSPWDVIDFSEETYQAPSLNQFGGNDNLALNMSLGDSSGVVKSVESMKDSMEMKTEEDNGGEEEEEQQEVKKKKKKKLNNKTSVVLSKRGPGRAKKESSNRNEFYYYSGFGPSWGNKRIPDRINGGGEEGNIKNKSSSKSKDTTPPTSLTDTSSEELDFVEEEEDDYDYDDDQRSNNGGGGKKPVRKLVKARSLKSLM